MALRTKSGSGLPYASPGARLTRERVRGAGEAGNGALVERMATLRSACQALATELTATRRELNVAKAELRKLKERDRDACDE